MDSFRYRSADLFFSQSATELPKKEQFFMHTHTHAELYCFLSGKGIFHVEGSAYSLLPGDILLMRPTEAHYIEIDPSQPYERIVINFDPNLIHTLDPSSGLLRPFYARKSGKRNLHRKQEDPDFYTNHLFQMIRHSANRAVIIARLVLLLQILQEDFDNTPVDVVEPDTIEYRIIRYINKNLHEELTLQSLCDHFFISRAQLCRRFKVATGTSVAKYVSVKRLIAAQQLIIQGQKPTDVYIHLGYRDYSTFYRAYTAYFGISPKEPPLPPSDEDGEAPRNNIG